LIAKSTRAMIPTSRHRTMNSFIHTPWVTRGSAS